jgi:hypothetical protein
VKQRHLKKTLQNKAFNPQVLLKKPAGRLNTSSFLDNTRFLKQAFTWKMSMFVGQNQSQIATTVNYATIMQTCIKPCYKTTDYLLIYPVPNYEIATIININNFRSFNVVSRFLQELKVKCFI